MIYDLRLGKKRGSQRSSDADWLMVESRVLIYDLGNLEIQGLVKLVPPPD